MVCSGPEGTCQGRLGFTDTSRSGAQTLRTMVVHFPVGPTERVDSPEGDPSKSPSKVYCEGDYRVNKSLVQIDVSSPFYKRRQSPEPHGSSLLPREYFLPPLTYSPTHRS